MKSHIPPELMAELVKVAGEIENDIRDPEGMRKAAERMDRMREELRKKHGVLNVAVDLIRETRDDE